MHAFRVAYFAAYFLSDYCHHVDSTLLRPLSKMKTRRRVPVKLKWKLFPCLSSQGFSIFIDAMHRKNLEYYLLQKPFIYFESPLLNNAVHVLLLDQIT